ncbi:MAG: thiolase family protein [Dehalococcoidia bacterium]
MSKRVAMVAVAQTKYSTCRNDVRQEELVHEVVKQVMEQTGLKFAEDGTGIDCSVIVSDDFWEARTISDVPPGDAVGGHGRDMLKVAQDGSMGVLYGAATVLSGHDDIVLVAGGFKESQILSRNLITSCGFDPVYIRKLGLDYVSAAALQATRYMHKYGITREQCAKVVVKNHKNAKNNPYALWPMDLKIEDVLKSKMLASPISELDAYPASDGAIAIILATEEKAKKLTNKPVWIEGIGSCRDAHNPGERELADCDSLVDAARQAYRMAGIKNPQKDIDVFEISEHCSYQELLWSEGLGLCGRGEGGKLIDSGKTQLTGALPINPSGGVLSGVPALLAGMSRVAESFFQLRGEAGKRQVDKAKKALAHGTTGPCGQMHCVIILGR